eukprot:SAG31_NODE_7660_length_1626_cov_0.819908_2_plen_147_part_00
MVRGGSSSIAAIGQLIHPPRSGARRAGSTLRGARVATPSSSAGPSESEPRGKREAPPTHALSPAPLLNANAAAPSVALRGTGSAQPWRRTLACRRADDANAAVNRRRAVRLAARTCKDCTAVRARRCAGSRRRRSSPTLRARGTGR